MTRARAAWELCERNGFSGIHTWMLEYPKKADGKRDMKAPKTAFCHVCGAQPDQYHKHAVNEMLTTAADIEVANERMRANLRALHPRAKR